MKPVKASLKLFLFALWSLFLVPPQIFLMVFFKGPVLYALPCLWHGFVCALFGIRFQIEGRPQPQTKDSQTIFISNHLSYMDIPLIGSVLKASFLAKSEVKSWPVFGFLSRLQQTAFIERKRTAIGKESESIAQLLKDNKNLVIFAEGTSTDGREVRPFKSSLFALALNVPDRNLYIQPMTVRVDRVDGHPPATQDLRDLYAWHVDMTTSLAAHLWRFLKTSGADLTLVFHDPLPAKDFENRKTLAKACHERVSKGLKIKNAA